MHKFFYILTLSAVLLINVSQAQSFSSNLSMNPFSAKNLIENSSLSTEEVEYEIIKNIDRNDAFKSFRKLADGWLVTFSILLPPEKAEKISRKMIFDVINSDLYKLLVFHTNDLRGCKNLTQESINCQSKNSALISLIKDIETNLGRYEKWLLIKALDRNLRYDIFDSNDYDQ